MPLHDAELVSHLCQRYAKENGYLYDPNGDAFISVADGWAVMASPHDNTDVLATYYRGCSLLKIERRKTSMSYGRRKRCKKAEEAVGALASSSSKKSSRKRKADDTAVVTIAEKSTPDNWSDDKSTAVTETAFCNSASNVTAHEPPDNCTNSKIVGDADYAGDIDLIVGEDGKLHRVRVGGDDAGVVDGECRDYENERASFNKIKDVCLDSCNPYTTCAITLGTYIRQSFNDVQKAVLKLLKKNKGFLFKNYENLKCGFMFLEPYANGGFHCHLLLCFYDEVPDDLYENILTQWKKRIIVPTETYKTDEHLVKMRGFYSVEEFTKYLDYLNPVSKKKRARLKYYPRRRNARRGYGNLTEPNSVILTASEAKRLTECEYVALRHEIKILNASSTIFSGKEDVRVHNFTYYYTTNEDLWNSIIVNGRVEQNIFCEAESTPPTTDSQPHFSISIFTKSGERFGKTMTEIDFNYNVEEAIKLADFYERNSKLFGGVEVVREGIPLQ